jgi:hypothetical protein
MTKTRLAQLALVPLAAATLLGTASTWMVGHREQPSGTAHKLVPSGESARSLATRALSPGEASLASEAISKYNKTAPRLASDYFHRWRFDALKANYPANPELQRKVSDLLSASGFRKTFPKSPPLFFRSPYGWEVRQRTAEHSRERWEYEHHLDQFLATCAEIGVPLSLAIDTDFGPVRVGELIDASRRSFDPSQEQCWTLVAYCTYLPDEPSWQNRFGEGCSYDGIVEAILACPLDSGPCGGAHKQFALACYLNHPSSGDRSLDLRRRCEEYLDLSSRMLERSQLINGAWPLQWASSPDDRSGVGTPDSTRGIDLIRITGHQLEWIFAAPQAVRPSNASISRAMRFLAEGLQRADEASIKRDYCAYSHAACVLTRITQNTTRFALKE